jgi:hypothetical protein
MALGYYLEMETQLKPPRALEVLAAWNRELAWSEEGFLLSDSTIITSTSEFYEGWRESIHHGFSFTPTLSVGFRFISNTDYDRFRQLMLQATMLLLEHARDAVLLFNAESIVLQRLGGRLTFNSEQQIWDDDWLKSRMDASYELRSSPSPLL